MKTILKSITTLENRNAAWACVALTMLALALCFVCTTMPAAAQTAGEGSLQGTVTDSTGAVVPHASITITNNATGIKTVSEATYLINFALLRAHILFGVTLTAKNHFGEVYFPWADLPSGRAALPASTAPSVACTG